MKAEVIDVQFKEEDLKQGDWVYTPSEVYGSGGKTHNIFTYDERINYSVHLGDGDMVFYKLIGKSDNLIKLSEAIEVLDGVKHSELEIIKSRSCIEFELKKQHNETLDSAINKLKELCK